MYRKCTLNLLLLCLGSCAVTYSYDGVVPAFVISNMARAISDRVKLFPTEY